eukprot:SAG11_NODE_3910_length_2153_cov_2.209834_1_plen_63_part_00
MRQYDARPPSTGSTEPVNQALAGAHSKSTSIPMSLCNPQHGIGIRGQKIQEGGGGGGGGGNF